MLDGEGNVESFLADLAVKREVASATQNQAMNVLVFLYKQVLELSLDEQINAIRSYKNSEKLLFCLNRRSRYVIENTWGNLNL